MPRFCSRASFAGLGLLVAVVFGTTDAAAADPTLEQCLSSSETAQRLRDEGKYLRARELFANCAARSCPAVVQRECASSADGVERVIPSLVFAVRDEHDRDVPDARVVLDGAALDGRVRSTPLPVDAGEHVVRVEASGFTAMQQKVIATAGEKNRVIVVKLARAAPPAAPASNVASANVSANATNAPQRGALAPNVESRPSGLSPTKVLATSSFALAGVGAAASIVLGLGTRSDLEDLRRAPCAATRTCSQDDVDSGKARLVIADVFLGASLFLAGAGLYLWFTDAKGSGASIAVRPRGGGLALDGSF